MSAHVEVAKQFGDLLAKEDYVAARALLTTEAQALHSADDLKTRAEGMRRYAPGPIRNVEVMQEFILEDWPAKQAKDVAIDYVSLDGDNFCEAVSVTVV